MIRQSVSNLRPSEKLTALVLASLLLLGLLTRPEGWRLRVAVFAILLLATVALSGAPRKPWMALARDVAPVIMVLGVYLLLQPLVAAANSIRWDAALAAVDARWFPSIASSWRGAFGRPAALTDLVYIAYASFYLLPVVVALLVRFRIGPGPFERVTFTILLGFYLSFLGYFLWPAEGPRVPRALEAAQLGGGAISRAVRVFLHQVEATTLDAFPSGHTALSLVPAILATRFLPGLGPFFWAWALAILFSTVYISVHYVADVAAGILLAGATLALAPQLSRWMDAAENRKNEQRTQSWT